MTPRRQCGRMYKPYNQLASNKAAMLALKNTEFSFNDVFLFIINRINGPKLKADEECMRVFAFAAPPAGSGALCRDVICLCLPTAPVSPVAPEAEPVALARPRDLYSKQHMEETLLGQRHRGAQSRKKKKNTSTLSCHYHGGFIRSCAETTSSTVF